MIYVMLLLDRCGKHHVPIVRRWPDNTIHGEPVFLGGVDGVVRGPIRQRINSPCIYIIVCLAWPVKPAKYFHFLKKNNFIHYSNLEIITFKFQFSQSVST